MECAASGVNPGFSGFIISCAADLGIDRSGSAAGLLSFLALPVPALHLCHSMTPEAHARDRVHQKLIAAGWAVRNSAGRA